MIIIIYIYVPSAYSIVHRCSGGGSGVAACPNEYFCFLVHCLPFSRTTRPSCCGAPAKCAWVYRADRLGSSRTDVRVRVAAAFTVPSTASVVWYFGAVAGERARIQIETRSMWGSVLYNMYTYIGRTVPGIDQMCPL